MQWFWPPAPIRMIRWSIMNFRKFSPAWGIPVLTADSLPEEENVDLSCSRLDIVNNFHARMLSSAVLTARESALEYVQIVSFGCGHDAYLSDEIVRLDA